MQEKQILQYTKKAVDQLTPDCFDAIWERATNATPEEYPLPNVPLPIKRQRKSARTWIAAMTVLAACMLCFFGFRWYEYYAVYTTINLDVNPSISISINRQEEILSMTGLNADGESVVDALSSPIHRPLDEVVTETIVELVEEGYFTTDDANAILISVDARDSSNAEELMENLSNQVSIVMGKKEISGDIMSQQIPRDDKEVEQLAKELHISNGKAALIKNMTLENPNFSQKDLADMKISEIVETARSECMDMSSFAQPARLQSVSASKATSVPDVTATPKVSSSTGESSGKSDTSSDKNTKNNSSQGGQTAGQDSTTGAAKQQNATAVPKATEKPKATTAPKTDNDKNHSDNQNQKDNQKGLDTLNQKEMSQDKKDSSDDTNSIDNSVLAPEPTGAVENREQQSDSNDYPNYPQYPDFPRYSGNLGYLYDTGKE